MRKITLDESAAIAAIRGIDFALLAKQKSALFALTLQGVVLDKETIDAIDGVVNLLDAIDDCVKLGKRY